MKISFSVQSSGSQRKERKTSGAGSHTNRSPKRPRSDSGELLNGVDSSPTPAKVMCLDFLMFDFKYHVWLTWYFVLFLHIKNVRDVLWQCIYFRPLLKETIICAKVCQRVKCLYNS